MQLSNDSLQRLLAFHLIVDVLAHRPSSSFYTGGGPPDDRAALKPLNSSTMTPKTTLNNSKPAGIIDSVRSPSRHNQVGTATWVKGCALQVPPAGDLIEVSLFQRYCEFIPH